MNYKPKTLGYLIKKDKEEKRERVIKYMVLTGIAICGAILVVCGIWELIKVDYCLLFYGSECLEIIK